jgi:hypothetical protein
VRACDAEAWHLALEHKETGERKSVPYRCCSWRHTGPCARSRAAEDARRIREGFIRYGKSMAYLVLTFNPAGHSGGIEDAYRIIVRCWQVLYQRISRRWDKGPYVVLVEQHRSGWPHVNVLLGGHVGAEVAAGRWRTIRRELAPLVIAAGFGLRLWVDERAGTAALPQYIAKYCTKAEQAPLHAPPKFRRLRATRGFLGAPKKSGETYTGRLVTEAAAQREEMEAQRDRAVAQWRDIGETLDGGEILGREIRRIRNAMLAEIARGEESGAELGITDDPATWPEEWTTSPRGRYDRSAAHAECGRSLTRGGPVAGR